MLARDVKFENTLEKLGRIISSQYGVRVIFEGNSAGTDGKNIYLPFFKTMDQETKADLNGYLDHEVAHCRFTDFKEWNKIKKKSLRELCNSAEDIRIEKEMIDDLPGTQFNLGPLRDKVNARNDQGWSKIPALERIFINIQRLMEGRAVTVDKDIEEYLEAVDDCVEDFKKCKNTADVVRVATEVMKRLKDEHEEQKKNGGGAMGKEQHEKMGRMLDEEASGEGTGEGGKEKSEFSGASDITKFINKELKEHIDEDKAAKSSKGKPGAAPEGGTPGDVKIDPEWGPIKIVVPMSTRFDKVHDHTGKGDSHKYAEMRDEVKSLVGPIKQQLERILKTRENARWTPERERGKLNSRSLANLMVNQNYRTPFREFSKTETNNVAVEILIDLSGSMGGGGGYGGGKSKVEVAKRTAIALSEALTQLGIAHEVTGFTSMTDSGLSKMAAAMGDTSRFDRVHERLDLHVFKDFNAVKLVGITKASAMSNNPDGECVKWAATRLAERKENRKILMVLSDGQPAAEGNFATLHEDLRTRVKQIEKSGIEVVGIGILTDAPKHYYKDTVTVMDLKELPGQAMKKLSEIILKVGR